MQRHRGVKEHGLFQERGEPQAEAIRMNHGRNEAVEGSAPKSGKGGGFSECGGRSEALAKGRRNSDCLWWGSRAWTWSMKGPHIGCVAYMGAVVHFFTTPARNEEA